MNFECTICNESIHPNDVINIINEIKNGKIIIEDSIDICEFLNKYENLFLQSTLEKIPGISWCPGTDCNYAVITKCAKSKNTKVTCENKECGIIFCSYCSSPWHKGISCKKNIRIMNKDMIYSNVEGVKNCPNCLIPIYRINDGSCNHIYCPICKIEFCWLCLKNVTEFHYITYSTTIIFFRASGCTFYGSNAWTSKKKLLVGLCLILFAPLMVTIPGILFAAFLLYYFPYKMIIQVNI
ncbi:hypothetical protein MXB_831 [Myxobolus squamalis]|nr:hypothetical protein MXB_831 [Myxobolus squamalis]